jgi:hypothetical protein
MIKGNRFIEFTKVLAALLMVLGVLLACKGGKDSGGSGSSGGTAKLGEQVKLDESAWTVIEAKDLGKSIKATSELFADEKKDTTGKFVQVHYKVVNNGKKQETLLDTPKIVDSKSREFGPIQSESEYVPKGSKAAILETLQPSMEKDFYTIIEVPADATGLKVQVTGLGLLGDKKMVDIGM